MKKYFISSDIHGFFDEWSTALKEAGFDINNEDHIIIVCGDLLDRGEQARECLRFVLYDLPKERRILIKGNHEELMEQVIRKGYFESHDLHNRTDKTVYQLTNIYPDIDGLNTSRDAIEAMKDCKLWNDYINECVDYYEIGDNIFVHGWIPTIKSYGMFVDRVYPYDEDHWKDGNWSQARWENGMQMWDYGYGIPGKTIWCGHWHCSWGNSLLHNDGLEFNEDDWGEPILLYDSQGNKLVANFEPFEDVDDKGCGIKAIDACCAYSGKLNVVTLEY